MNSVSGWRASDRSAPGTTTTGPISPPMASSAILTFWAIGVGLPSLVCEVGSPRRDNSGSAGRIQRASPRNLLLDSALFGPAGERRERARGRIAGFRRLEGDARLARIRIDTEQEKLGRQQPQ